MERKRKKEKKVSIRKGNIDGKMAQGKIVFLTGKVNMIFNGKENIDGKNYQIKIDYFKGWKITFFLFFFFFFFLEWGRRTLLDN